MTGSWWEQQAPGIGGLVSLGASGHPWGAGVCVTATAKTWASVLRESGAPQGQTGDCPWLCCGGDILKGECGAPGIQPETPAPIQAQGPACRWERGSQLEAGGEKIGAQVQR